MSTVKVLVTGATVDTGGYAVTELLARGLKVWALAHKPDERSKKLEDRGVEVVFGDRPNGKSTCKKEGRSSGSNPTHRIDGSTHGRGHPDGA